MAQLRFKCINILPGNEHPEKGMSVEFIALEDSTQGVTVTGSLKLKTDDKEAAENFQVGKIYAVELSDSPADENDKPQPFSDKPAFSNQPRQMGINERGPERRAVKLEGSAAAAVAHGGPKEPVVKDDAPSTLNKK